MRNCCLDAEVQESRRAVQQICTATYPPSTDPMRPKQTRELYQRPAETSMPLVHTEEVTGSIPVSPTGSGPMPTSLKITLGSHSSSQRSASRCAPSHGG
jgi:hypothetical protein